jgi:hypothetical protein
MSAMPVLLIKVKTALTRRSAAKAKQPRGLRPPLRRGSNASQALDANDSKGGILPGCVQRRHSSILGHSASPSACSAIANGGRPLDLCSHAAAGG